LTVADVLIRRGVAGLQSVSRSDVPGNYPYEAIRVAKLMRAAGLTVEFEDEKPDRTYLTHDAAEFWLPIIEFARDFGKEAVITTLTGLVSSYATMKIVKSGESGEEVTVPSPVLHVEVTRQGDPTTKLVLDGPADSVLEAITKIERWGSEDEHRQLPEG
jgi:hypothetical protein